MADAGRLELDIAWDGETVRDAGVKSTRPRADRLLEGRAPQEAARLASLLFGVCGKAQGAAAEAATAAAQGEELVRFAALDRATACEAMQEHLWRLLLDWPELLDLPRQQPVFVRWHGVLNAIAAGAGDARRWSDELHRTLTGMACEEWARLDSHAALAEWSKAGQGLCAPVVAALDALEGALDRGDGYGSEECGLLPEWSAAEAWRNCAGRIDHEFAAQPHCDGRPMETGALARWQHEPLLRDILRRGRLLARLVARLYDLLDSAEKLARGESAQRIRWFAAETGARLALARTARGTLMHYARIESGRIAEYRIVAPTEWNFHPRGAWRAGLADLRERDAARVLEAARCLALSLDPCVEYAMEVRRA